MTTLVCLVFHCILKTMQVNTTFIVCNFLKIFYKNVDKNFKLYFKNLVITCYSNTTEYNNITMLIPTKTLK